MSKTHTVMDFLGGLDDETPNKKQAEFIPIDAIQADPNQPRKHFDDERHQNLVESIREMGLLQPILLRETQSHPAYEIIAGERRWRAAKAAGLAEIPAFIRNDLTRDQVEVAQIVENTQRSDLSDFEFAQSLKRVLEAQPKMKQKDLAKLFDRPPSYISRLMAMLDSEWLALTSDGTIKKAAVLEKFKSLPKDTQQNLLDYAQATGLSITSEAINEVVQQKQAMVAVPQAIDDSALDLNMEQSETVGRIHAEEVSSSESEWDDGSIAHSDSSGESQKIKATAPVEGKKDKAMAHLNLTAQDIGKLLKYLNADDLIEIRVSKDVADAFNTELASTN